MPEKILVVDDCLDEVEPLLTSLNQQRWDVVYFTSGGDALRHIKINPPDLIISDWEMPGMTGHHLMKLVADDKELRLIPFFLVHYDWTPEIYSLPACNGRTADCHIYKPFTEQNLKEIKTFATLLFKPKSSPCTLGSHPQRI